VLLTSSGARYFVRQITESIIPNLTVLSHNEIPPGNRIVSLGAVN
jgi:flagellar biosynthesis protein FlhA